MYPNRNTLVQDFADFSQQDIHIVWEKISNFRTINTKDFYKKNSHQDFYATSKTYVYDLLSANHTHEVISKKLNRFIPNFINLIGNHPGSRFLEFGGGTGGLVEIVESKTNKQVTYVDVDSYISAFARWRLKKYNCQIETIIIPQDDFDLPQLYDVIFTDAVFEHLPQEQQLRYAQKLSSFLSDNGLLLFLVDLTGEDDEMPMHFNVDIKALHKTLHNNGLTCYYGKNQFASVWSKGHLPYVSEYFPQSLIQRLRHRWL
jgi:cyclopropane fatty-acyl-phospholipid synthase-like methyltransferase